MGKRIEDAVESRAAEGWRSAAQLGLLCVSVVTAWGCQKEEEPVRREAAMMPLGSGTLGVSPDGSYALAAYAERGAVFVTNVATKKTTTVELSHEQLGRVLVGTKWGFVADGKDSRVSVIDLETAEELQTLDVCEAPRGLALSKNENTLYVACGSGWLWSVSLEDGSVSRKVQLDPDLRDVQRFGDGLAVSTFRGAEVLILDADGQETARFSPPHLEDLGEPKVAWRMSVQQERIYLLYQYNSEVPLGGGPGGYYGNGCSFQVVVPTVGIFEEAPSSRLEDGELGRSPPEWNTEQDAFWLESMVHLNGAAGALDMAVLADGGFAVTVPGNAWAPNPRKSMVMVPQPPAGVSQNRDACDPQGTFSPPASPGVGIAEGQDEPPAADDAFVGVAASPRGIIMQVAERAELSIDDTSGTQGDSRVELQQGVATNTGHRLFHMSTDLGIACVSCHPDGNEDGHTWNFTEFGLRRTQSLRGGVSMRSAFHWDGSLTDFEELMDEVFGGRMGMRVMPSAEQQNKLLTYLDTLPKATHLTPTNSDLVSAGAALFVDEKVGCADCHSGPRLSDGKLYDVGTGGKFLTPSLLGIGTRAPYMHDGCAASLQERFGACGGGDRHGVTSHLNAQEIDALVAFLQSQ